MKAWLGWIRARYSEPPPSVPAEHQRFYFAASYGYPCGLLWHFLFIFLFWRVGARPLGLLNIGATGIWILALALHLSGRLRGAVVLAALEISVHAALCVVFIGWGAGFQFYILAMAAVVFFAPLGRMEWNIALAALNAVSFVGLHYLFVDAPPRIPLAPWVMNALLLRQRAVHLLRHFPERSDLRSRGSHRGSGAQRGEGEVGGDGRLAAADVRPLPVA